MYIKIYFTRVEFIYKDKKTLIFDLDETLIHSVLE